MDITEAQDSVGSRMRVAEPRHHLHHRGLEGSAAGDRLRGHHSDRPAEASSNQAGGSGASLTFRRTERMGLFIETQEGDVVRLRFRNRESLTLDAARVQSGDEEASEITLRSRTNSKIALSIEGDLNADELAAIQDAFDQATALADEFFAGNVQAAFEGAASLGFDAAQLAQVNFRASVKEQLTYAVVSFASAAAVPALTEGAVEEAAPAEDAEEMHTQPFVGPDVAAEADVVPVANGSDAAETVAEGEDHAEAVAAEDTGVSPESDASNEPESEALDPRRIIGDFLSKLTAALSGGSGTQSTGMADFTLKIHMFQSTLITLSESRSAAEPSIPELVPQTLDALAERQRAPLDQVA